jgi:K+/H+ antiporter YhaU regulatory subunit KhtT
MLSSPDPWEVINAGDILVALGKNKISEKFATCKKRTS